ncbi:uncharacterized protein EI97DRAFT_461102 [Westerdykella ornata]|uniref:BZIP domain-containing protein n=1 Tax=Westerdykella ornata TaxID=318751 RepID=A0A6A6JB90_WESOR|nr:uncharacterized protein EI97DRAFT_461102 [Westerdykella ornata]KAF2273443.1 hypothetical protein EI97DRAFT_461102 [Westerdykella ornata]
MTSSESEDHPASRKRSRVQKNTDSANKKARGRPRVEAEDATAADRRRTQIRLAQRAYRQRKETTISSLKEQNARLLSIIEEMNQTLSQFHESVLKDGILQYSTRLAHDLKQMSDTFGALTKTALAEGSHERSREDADTEIDPPAGLQNASSAALTSPESNQTTQYHLPIAQRPSMGWASDSHTVSAMETPPEAQEDNVSLNLFDAYERENVTALARRFPLTTSTIFDQSSSQSTGRGSWPQLPFGLVHIDDEQAEPQLFNVNIPTPAMTPPTLGRTTPPLLSTRTLKPSWTYSHEETTFARRLGRACLEVGFHLLSSPHLRPAVLNFVFKLSLAYLTIDQLRDRFKMLLKRGVTEDLDCVGTPFAHFGGSGTHYARKSVAAKLPGNHSSWNVRSIGPLHSKLARIENTTDPSKGLDLNVDISGYEGEWFDCEDVQGYLEQEKGCYINPRESFAQVEIDIEEEKSMHELGNLAFSSNVDLNLDLSSASGPSLSGADGSSPSSGTWSTGNASNKSSPINNDSVVGTNTGINFGMGSLSNSDGFSGFDLSTMMNQPFNLDFTSGMEANGNTTAVLAGYSSSLDTIRTPPIDLTTTEMLTVVQRKRKKPAWVDVSKLIDELLRNSVCLGRTPGFRRKDVDRAFQASLISAF